MRLTRSTITCIKYKEVLGVNAQTVITKNNGT